MERESNGQLYLWHGRSFRFLPRLPSPHFRQELNIVPRRRFVRAAHPAGSPKSKRWAFEPYGHRFDFTHTIPQILAEYGEKTAERAGAARPGAHRRPHQTIRRMGKAGFAHLLQNGERLQIYVRKDAVGENDFALYQLLDLGDIIGVEGYLFRTRTGELSVHVEQLYFLAKTLLSMPEKWHGLEDVETRYRQRYLDLIANPGCPQGVSSRARRSSRRCGGSWKRADFWKWRRPCCSRSTAARRRGPSRTHHNTLDIDLYLRIAPELYLKRLVVGGLERVYEINRNFRNEGISTQHNPEFTMLEFYQAYTDYHGMMDLSEELLRQAAIDATGVGGGGIPGRADRLRQYSAACRCVKRWAIPASKGTRWWRRSSATSKPRSCSRP